MSLRNLWSEPLKCKLCDAARTHGWASDRCESCGTWQGRILTREESEREAERLLKKEGFVSRCDLNQLLAISLSGWTSSARTCDREAARMGSSGLTLGLYVYGSKVGLTKSCLERPNLTRLLNRSKVGLTKSCLERPNLTRLLNRYLKQNSCQATWTALRVTCNFEAQPHQDRNSPGSMNIVAPISWFGEGRIWVQGDPPEGCGRQVVEKEYKGKQLRGYHVGGAREIAQFDPSRPHAVEPSVGDRRVVVAYSPRLIDRLMPSELEKLKELGFNIPSFAHPKPVQDCNSTSQAKGGDNQEQHGSFRGETDRKEGSTPASTGEEDCQAGFSPGGDGSKPGRWEIREHLDPEALDEARCEFVRMRQLEIECRKLLDEQLEMWLESGGESEPSSEDSPISHVLGMKAWVHDLEKWLVQHDALGRLHEGMLGCEEVRVLRARLCSMNLTCPSDDNDHGGGIDVPLSDEPLPDLEAMESDAMSGVAKQWQAVPAGPLQTVTISNKEFLDNLEVAAVSSGRVGFDIRFSYRAQASDAIRCGCSGGGRCGCRNLASQGNIPTQGGYWTSQD